jgi:hypothetical protein
VDEEGSVSSSAKPIFCEALTRLGDVSENGAQLKAHWLAGEKFFDRYEDDGRTITTRQVITLGKAAHTLAQQLLEAEDQEAAKSLANSLLLVGYQLSRNGENNVVATLRVALWQDALELMKASGDADTPSTRSAIEEAEHQMQLERIGIRERDPDRLFYPFG